MESVSTSSLPATPSEDRRFPFTAARSGSVIPESGTSSTLPMPIGFPSTTASNSSAIGKVEAQCDRCKSGGSHSVIYRCDTCEPGHLDVECRNCQKRFYVEIRPGKTQFVSNEQTATQGEAGRGPE